MNWRLKTSRGEPVKNRVTLPVTMIEIQPGFALCARVSGAPQPRLRRMALTGLDGGVVTPSPLLPNIANAEAMKQALDTILRSVGNGGGNAGLLLPDGAVRISVLEFDVLPSKAKELDALLRWRIKDGLGFAPEEARISYQTVHQAEGRTDLLVAAVKNDVLAQYETLIEQTHGGVALALPATMALLPLLSDAEPGGQLLTHVCSGWVTHALVEGKRLRFWRTRQLTHAEEASEASEVVSEAARAAASARDRWGLEIARAWFCSRPRASGELKAALVAALGVPVGDLEAGEGIAAELGAEERPLANMFAAPFGGLISNYGRAS